jgi:hypothetical protein
MTTRGSRIYIAHNIWKEQQPDGSDKYFTIHPETRQTIEIDEDQVYFWTDEWQAKEREADEDIAAGRVERFKSADDFIASLKPRE